MPPERLALGPALGPAQEPVQVPPERRERVQERAPARGPGRGLLVPPQVPPGLPGLRVWTSGIPRYFNQSNFRTYRARASRRKGSSLTRPSVTLQSLQSSPRTTPLVWQWSTTRTPYCCPVGGPPHAAHKPLCCVSISRCSPGSRPYKRFRLYSFCRSLPSGVRIFLPFTRTVARTLFTLRAAWAD